MCILYCMYKICRGWQSWKTASIKLLFALSLAEFPNSIVVNVNRPSNTKLRRQVKQARPANKNARCTGAAHLLQRNLMLL